MFFCSVHGVQNLTLYNTFIETCKYVEVSSRDYFNKLFREIKKVDRL